MKKFDNLGEVLQFAISLEQMSYEFYIDLSKRTASDVMKKVLLDFADEEKGHKQRLERIVGVAENISTDTLNPEELSRYIAAVPIPENMTYEQAIKIAMNKEHAAMMLYQILAKMTEEKALRDVLELLAVEEAHHKRRFEKEYHEIKTRSN
jgi:rubrerythrin